MACHVRRAVNRGAERALETNRPWREPKAHELKELARELEADGLGTEASYSRGATGLRAAETGLSLKQQQLQRVALDDEVFVCDSGRSAGNVNWQ